MGKALRRGRQWFGNATHPHIADWALAAALLACGYFVFMYTDLLITLEDSVQLWDAGLRGFYQYNLEYGAYFTSPAFYEIPLYIIFGIWNLPLWLGHRFFGLAYMTNPIALLWAKGMLVAFLFGCAWLVVKIGGDLGLDEGRTKWAAFAFLTSISTIVPVLVTAQYDVVALLFMLLGVRAFIRGRGRGFTLWFLLAATCKTFALLVYIPLVLLREKRLVQAAWKIALGFTGLAACKLLYMGDAAYHASTAVGGKQMFARLFEGQITLGLGGVALLVSGIGAVCIWCWLKKPAPQAIGYYGIYVPLLCFVLLFSLCYGNPYWVVLYTPFMALAAFATPRRTDALLLLDVLGEAALHFVFLLVFHAVYTVENLRTLLLPALFRGHTAPRYTLLGQLLPADIGVYLPAAMAVMLCCHAAFLYLCRPGRQALAGGEGKPRVKRSILWARLLAPAVFMGGMLALFFIQQPQVLVFNEDAVAATSASLLDGRTVTQELEFDGVYKLEDIGLLFTGSGEENWDVGDYVVLVLREAESGKQLYRGYLGVNELEWNGWTHFGLGSVKVAPDARYTLEVSAFHHKVQELCLRLAEPGILAAAEGTGEEGYSLALYIAAKP